MMVRVDVKIKDGLNFSDGSPLTAKDVVFTYNNAAASGGKVDMGNFAKEEINPSTVRMTLSAPQSTFINVLGSLGIVSADKYDAKNTPIILSSRSLSLSELPTRSAINC